MVHLICLRCNRANAADSKFCSECGAGLLRKFCHECHAVNDAESHFCQSCGAALSAPPSVSPAPSAPPPGDVPDLTDVAYLEPDEPPGLVSAAVHLDSGPIAAVPAQWPALPAETPRAGNAATSAYRTPIVLGVGGAAAVLLAALLWPGSESPPALSDAGSMRGSSSTFPGKGTAGATAMPVLTEAAVPPAKPASASSDGLLRDTAVAPLAPRPGPAKQPDKVQPQSMPVDRILAVQPPAAGPAKLTPTAERPRSAPTPPRPRPTAPPPECTPQVDALGLCAQGAKVTGR